MPDPSPRCDRAARLIRRLASERLFLTILGIALALPLLLSRGRDDRLIFGPPLVTSGDELHYLVMLHSLLDDRDLDLKNNYDSARRGSIELGAERSGAPLDHQVSWYAPDGSWHQWGRVFEYASDPASSDGLALMPSIKPGARSEFSTRPQYSQHPPGLPLLLAAPLYPVRGTIWVEHLALVLTALGTLAMALFLRELFRAVSDDAGVVNAATLLAVLGSPTWHYGRMLFTEPWLTLCAVGALALAIRKNAFFWAGCFIALGIQMKPPFALLAVPLAFDRLLARDFKRTIEFSLPVAASTALVLIENQHFFGSPLRSSQPWASGNLLVGVSGLLLSWNHGLLIFCPALVIAAFGWRALFRTHRRLAWLCAAMVLPYFLLMSLWKAWDGGYCYGPRLIAPIIPFLFLGLVQIFSSFSERTARLQRALIATSSVSLLIAALGTLLHMAFWSKHPLITPVLLLAQRW
jgi:hypothetical protein